LIVLLTLDQCGGYFLDDRSRRTSDAAPPPLVRPRRLISDVAKPEELKGRCAGEKLQQGRHLLLQTTVRNLIVIFSLIKLAENT